MKVMPLSLLSFLSVFWVFVASSSKAYGQAIVGEIEEEKEIPTLKKWKGSFEVRAMTGLDTPNEERPPTSISFQSLFFYHFSEKWSGQVFLGASKNLGGKREEQLLSSKWSMPASPASRAYPLRDIFSTGTAGSPWGTPIEATLFFT